MPYRWITRWTKCVPDEAHDLARAFRDQARCAREAADELARISADLRDGWEGQASRRFLPALESECGAAWHLAQRLEGLAGECERLQVTEARRTYEWVNDDRV